MPSSNEKIRVDAQVTGVRPNGWAIAQVLRTATAGSGTSARRGQTIAVQAKYGKKVGDQFKCDIVRNDRGQDDWFATGCVTSEDAQDQARNGHPGKRARRILSLVTYRLRSAVPRTTASSLGAGAAASFSSMRVTFTGSRTRPCGQTAALIQRTSSSIGSVNSTTNSRSASSFRSDAAAAGNQSRRCTRHSSGTATLGL